MNKDENAVLKVVKQAGMDFVEDDGFIYAAALAFYTALSFAPLLVILLWIAGSLGDTVRDSLLEQIKQLLGQESSRIVDTVVSNAASTPGLGSFAGIASSLMLLLAATGVLAQLQLALNRVWKVRAKPRGNIFRRGLVRWFRKRALSLGMILAIAFLLLASLVISSILAGLVGSAGRVLPMADWIWQVVDLFVSLVVYATVFALIFKYLPDTRVAWSDIWMGACCTALLFALGKWLIGMYIGNSTVGSSYGAASSLMVLLLWVYYAAIIFLLGAEMTRGYAKYKGKPIVPAEHATRIDSET